MVSIIIRGKAPLRISFAGGGTDVSPYPDEHGGCVLSCTIDKYSYCTLVPRNDNKVAGSYFDERHHANIIRRAVHRIERLGHNVTSKLLNQYFRNNNDGW